MGHEWFAELVDGHPGAVIGVLLATGLFCAWNAVRRMALKKPGSNLYGASGLIGLVATAVVLGGFAQWPWDLAAIAGGGVMTGVYALGALLGLR